METYTVRPIFKDLDRAGAFNKVLAAPGSKSITNRALMLAALSDGPCTLEGVLFSADSRHFLKCLQDLGYEVTICEESHRVTVIGCDGHIPKKEASIYVGSAGTAARFLTAMLGMSHGIYHLDASPQMRRRPMAPLLDSLRNLGCKITCHEREGYFPFTLEADGVAAPECTVDIGDSSQFLSALLMAAAKLDHDFTVHITGSHGLSYIRMTMLMMRQFGADVDMQDEHTYIVHGGSSYKAVSYQIEPDVSAAAYFYGMAAISGGTVLVPNVHFDSLQGDIQLIRTLTDMGCSAVDTPEGIRLTGPEKGLLKGLAIDMSSFSDQALTIGAIAPYADSPVTIQNVGHIRLQESDRMAAIVTNLGAMGIEAQIEGNDIIIHPGSPRPALIETYDDHRVAMAFALTGLRSPRIVIKDPLCCRKTFENYFRELDRICDETGI